MSLRALCVAAGLLLVAGAAESQSLGSGLLKSLGGGKDAAPAATAQQGSGTAGLLQSLGGGASMPALSGDNASNAAGVVTYCAKNNYLNADAATALKDKLLAKAGLQPAQAAQDKGYQSGLQGLLVGSDGQVSDMKTVAGKLKGKAKDKATKQACGYVLDNAGKLI